MKTFPSAIFACLLGVAGVSHGQGTSTQTQDGAPSDQRAAGSSRQSSSGAADKSGAADASGASGTSSSGASSAADTGSGSNENYPTSDRAISRGWQGIGSTGGGTGTGVSSGTTLDAPASGGTQQSSGTSR